MEGTMRLASFALAFCLLLGVPTLAAPGDALVVIGDGVNLRFEPRTDARVRAQVYRNQRVTELQREGDWVRVEIGGNGGQQGWIHGSLLAPQGGQRLAEPLSPAMPATTSAGKPSAPAQTALAAQPAPPGPPAAEVSGVEVPAPNPNSEPPAQMTEAPAPAATQAPSTEVTGAASAMPAEPAPEPSTIEPAAPAPDETVGIERFRESVDYLNSRAVSVAGVDLFAGVEPLGGGSVQVAATDAWSTIPPAGQESYANTLLDRWAAARGRTGPVSLRIVDPKGKVIMEKSRP
jgi:SH3 domain-containing protein